MMLVVRVAFLGLLGWLAVAPPASAQVAEATTGEITGRVIDENGGALGGVAVVAKPLSGDPNVTTTTAEDGSYRLTLPAGIYRLDFVKAGVPAYSWPGIAVLAGSTQVRDATLRVAAAGEGAGGAGPDAGATPVLVRLETALGDIDLVIDTARAPVTAMNFLKYVDGGFYDGGRFHRATRPDNYTPAPPNRPAMALIQGGINPSKRGEAFPPIPLERTSVTGLRHVVGVVSMARGTTADTATSDFFILLDDQPSLDFGGRRFDDGQGAAAFGRVVAGLDVVRRIQQQPVEGQSLTPPVPITRAYRVRRQGP